MPFCKTEEKNINQYNRSTYSCDLEQVLKRWHSKVILILKNRKIKILMEASNKMQKIKNNIL